jgi:hypothetical protein
MMFSCFYDKGANKNEMEGYVMKKMKKILALALSGVMVATLAVLTPITSRAEGKTFSYDVEWYDEDEDVVFATTTFIVNLQEGTYCWDGEEAEEYVADDFYVYAGRELYDEDVYSYWFGLGNIPSYFTEGDTVVFNLPFILDENKVEDAYLDDECELDSYTASTIKLVAVGERSDYACVELIGNFDYPSSYVPNEFWFEPMKTQLAIAAEVAAANGSAVAEASGDFGLSYEIMKWLEDHPGVTLNYTLTYNGEEHLIVIPGGQKLANPEIPWYGPEYLIGNFGK